MDYHTAFTGIDMNDSSNLSLGFELVRFQVDLSRTEFRYSDPDNLKQRTIQSLAHSLGLEYEYCLKTREATVTRSDILTSHQFEISCSSFDQEIITQGSCPPGSVSGGWPGINENVVFTKHPDRVTTPTDDLGTFDFLEGLDFSNDGFTMEEFDWNPSSCEGQAGATVMEPSGLRETLSMPPDLPNGQDLLRQPGAFCESVQFAPDLGLNGDFASEDPIQDQSCIPESPRVGDKSHFGSSREDICHDYPSTPPIHDPQITSPLLPLDSRYEELSDYLSETSTYNCWQASSRSGSRSRSRVGSRVGSSSSSIGSLNSDPFRGRASSVISKRPSMHRRNSSTRFQELVFDANPSRPSSATSTSSGRHKPLDSIARAAMKAVKAISACWRCRFLRKQCDTATPCEACPKGTQHSHWRSVGCKRGSLKAEMIHIPLCPQSHLGYSMTSEHLADENGDALRTRANDCSREAIRRRAAHTVAYDDPISINEADTDPFIQSLKSRWPPLTHVPGSKISSFDHPFPAKLLPLDQCILDIFWEAFDCPLSHSIIGSAGDLIMLRTAAMYQAKSETDQLIAQSLICLRSCLEALRVKNAGHLEEKLHQVCEPLLCKVDCIANITLSLELYVHELSRVFFKKENMRNKSWWLSVFYSFCIQSMVKHALIRLIGDAGPATQPTLGATLHLHLAVRLFIASSGSHDPLMRNYSIDSEPQSEEEGIRIKDYEQAQYASYKDQWAYFGIKSTKDFLERLFDI